MSDPKLLVRVGSAGRTAQAAANPSSNAKTAAIVSAYRPTSASTAKRPVSGSSSQAKHMPARGAGSSSTCTSDSAVEQQLEALRARMAQLESQRATAAEQLQWTIRQNKNTLLALKQENKELKSEVSRRGGTALLQGGTAASSSGAAGAGSSRSASAVSSDGGDTERLERQVHELRRMYDKMVTDKKSLAQKLDNLQVSLRDAAKMAAVAGSGITDAASSSMPSESVPSSTVAGRALSAGPAARELRQLQNRLDKALVKCNEAAAIKGTYESVLSRLKAEAPKMEAAIRTLQATLSAREGELESARRAAREAATARDAAKVRLAEAEAVLAANRARREQERTELRERVSTVHATNQALMVHQFKPLIPPKQPQQETGTHDSASATEPGNSNRPQETSTSGQSGSANAVLERLCAACGMSSTPALLSKLLAQQQSLASLRDMQGAAAAQRLGLEAQLSALRAHVEDLRGGGKLSTQRQLDAAQYDLLESQATLEAIRAHHDALLHVWVDARGGVEHLAVMSSHLPLPPGSLPVPVSDDTLPDVLAQCEQRLAAAHRFIHTMPKAAAMLEGLVKEQETLFAGGQ